MAIFWKIAARSVSNFFSLYFVYLKYLFISRFGFKSGICLLIDPVPVHCFSITFMNCIKDCKSKDVLAPGKMKKCVCFTNNNYENNASPFLEGCGLYIIHTKRTQNCIYIYLQSVYILINRNGTNCNSVSVKLTTS